MWDGEWWRICGESYIVTDVVFFLSFCSIQNFQGSITSQGKLLLHDKFMVLDNGNNAGGNNTGGNKKAKDCQVFLFEQSIIFSDITGKKTRFNNPSYLYKTHLQVRWQIWYFSL
jgi:hypothetical protein